MAPKTSYSLISLLISAGLMPSPALGLEVHAAGGYFSKPVKSFKELRSESVVAQSVDYSCGPAALATLLSYYFNDIVTENEIIRYLLLTGNLERIKARKGFSLLDLKNYCRYRGYRVTGYQGDLDFFAMLEKPVLVPINIKDYSHFVVLRGVRGDRVFLADPAMGKTSMLKAKFEKIWKEGIGLVLSREGEGSEEAPLKLSEEEEAVFADASGLKGMLGADNIGKMIRQGEF